MSKSLGGKFKRKSMVWKVSSMSKSLGGKFKRKSIVWKVSSMSKGLCALLDSYMQPKTLKMHYVNFGFL
jgi:hypothetical protein